MTTKYVLHAHDLDPRRATGIARYAVGLGSALQPLLRSTERATIVTARNCGSALSDHHAIPITRKYLYAAWLATGLPRWEWLVPTTGVLHATAPVVPTPTSRPLVVTVHDLTPLTDPQWYTPTAVSWFEKSIRWTKARADAVLTPTQYIADQVCDVLGLDPAIVTATGEGFDSARFDLSNPEPDLRLWDLAAASYVVYVGSLSIRKNLLSLIEGFPATGPLLVLAGPDGMGSDEVRRAASARPGRVRILGQVTDRQLGILVKNAVALVHASAFEGFGLTVLEAMSLGTPVLVSNAGALPEVVGNGGMTVASNDREGWHEALAVLTDPAALDRLSAAGLERSRAWSWESAAEKTLAVYRSLSS